MLLRILTLAACLLIGGFAQPPIPRPAPEPNNPDTDMKLPNGKSQRDAIAKDAYQKSLQDAAELVRLSEDLKADIEKNKAFVVSVPTIKKAEEIEKLAKRIRSRLTHG